LPTPNPNPGFLKFMVATPNLACFFFLLILNGRQIIAERKRDREERETRRENRRQIEGES